MLDHLAIQCADLDASKRFYAAVLAPLGGGQIMAYGPVTGYGVGDFPNFWLGPLTTGEVAHGVQATQAGHGVQATQAGREVHIAFQAPDRGAVRAFFDTAVATGATVLHEPREFPEYHPNYYGAFVRDPDGNNVEAVCHAPG